MDWTARQPAEQLVDALRGGENETWHVVIVGTAGADLVERAELEEAVDARLAEGSSGSKYECLLSGSE